MYFPTDILDSCKDKSLGNLDFPYKISPARAGEMCFTFMTTVKKYLQVLPKSTGNAMDTINTVYHGYHK